MQGFFEHFHFLRPWWLLALVLLPAIPWLWRRRTRAEDPWRRICDPHLLPWLGDGDSRGVRQAVLPWLLGIGWLVIVLALAGPAFRLSAQPVVRVQSPLILAVDLSERMRSTDLKPSRIARVRFKLADLLGQRDEGQTALVGYAGDAFTVAPLTDDAASLLDLAAAMSPEVMPVQGQRADRAMDLAVQLLMDAGHQRGQLLLITDQSDARALEAARRARSAGLEVSVLGVGTTQGAPVPQARGGFLLDNLGAILIPRLDEPGLRELARAGGGRYATLAVDGSDLASLGVLVARDGDGELLDADAGPQAWRDEGPWLLLLLLPLAALSFRRGWLTCVAVLMLLPGRPAQALDWGALWQRDDQRAWQALEEEQHQRAQQLAKDPDIRGSAAYRAGDYESAIEAFAAQDDAVSNYNRGNALARAGRYEEALAAYERALQQRDPFPDASANRDAVRDWLEQQPPQPDEGDGDASQQPGEGDSSSQQDSDSQAEPDESGEQSSAGDPSEQQQDETSDSEGSDAGEQESEQDSQSPTDGDQQGEDEQPPQEPETEQDDAQDQAESYAQEMQQALEQAESPDEEGSQAALSTEEAEKQQAMEHLLQRVPDDPGGLLRRKFQLEYQRRQQEGGRR